MFTELIEWHTLYGSKLGRDSVVLDLVANFGRFSKKIAQAYNCQIHSVEASPEIFTRLNDVRGITPYNYAIVGKVGPVPLNLSSNHLSASVFDSTKNDKGTVEISGIDLETFMQRHGIDRVDLLKIDIEGSEIEMFDACSDETLQGIGQITVEFHDFCGLISRNEVHRVLKRLEGLGFFAIRMSRVGHQDTWLINRRIHAIPLLQLLFIKYGERNWRGLKRIVRKAIFGRRWAEGYQ